MVLLALAAYVLGARAGQDRYEAIKRMATKGWSDPRTQKSRMKAKRARLRAARA
jgi:hypothetical protein